MGEADPARIHFTVWVDGSIPEVGYDQLEGEVLVDDPELERPGHRRIDGAGRPGRSRRLAEVWTGRFPDYYRVSASLEAAAEDILALEALSSPRTPFQSGCATRPTPGSL